MAINLANNNSLASITALPASISGGAMTLISTATASSSATLSFTSGIDDTYDEYVFKFYNIHPQTDAAVFTFNASIDGGSNYNVVKTTTSFYAFHNEADSSASLAYDTGSDLAQSTAFSRIIGCGNTGNDADQCGVGTMTLFNPSSTTFVKHFIAVGDTVGDTDYDMPGYIAGYLNNTSAVDAIQFKFDSGNIDSGVIKLYGIS